IDFIRFSRSCGIVGNSDQIVSIGVALSHGRNVNAPRIGDTERYARESPGERLLGQHKRHLGIRGVDDPFMLKRFPLLRLDEYLEGAELVEDILRFRGAGLARFW